MAYLQACVGRGLNVGDYNAGGVGGGASDGASAAAAVVLSIFVLIAVCEHEGCEAEDEDVFDLHVEGRKAFLGGG